VKFPHFPNYFYDLVTKANFFAITKASSFVPLGRELGNVTTEHLRSYPIGIVAKSRKFRGERKREENENFRETEILY